MTAPFELAALERWMDQEGLGRGPISDVTLLKGGTQNLLVSFARDDRTYVLRRPPLHLRPKSNETMRREARILAALARTDVPHPALIASCPDEGVLGTAFYLMEPVAGFNVGTGMPALHATSRDIRRQMGLNLVDAIAKLGRLDYLALGLETFGKPGDYLARQVDRWARQLASYDAFENWPGPAKLPEIGRLSRWLQDNRPPAFEPGIIHGDYHLRNVLYSHDGPELLAIVDWELTTIGDPLLDLGGLIATWRNERRPSGGSLAIEPWEGFPTAAELIARYREGSSRDLSCIDWYVAMACFKLGIILEGTYARACAGLADQATGDLLHSQTITLLERALDVVDGD